jgi:hypothetical protein
MHVPKTGPESNLPPAADPARWPEPRLVEHPVKLTNTGRGGNIQPANDARKRKANASAMGALTGAAILGGGLTAVLSSLPWWQPVAVAVIAWLGLGLIVSAINHARFGDTRDKQ